MSRNSTSYQLGSPTEYANDQKLEREFAQDLAGKGGVKLDDAEVWNAVNNTISEDLTDGLEAKLDASLDILNRDELVFALPNQGFEDNQTRGSGNHALQDYQMQLMLLEQQNKKRLMMARQEPHDLTAQRRQELFMMKKRGQSRTKPGAQADPSHYNGSLAEIPMPEDISHDTHGIQTGPSPLKKVKLERQEDSHPLKLDVEKSNNIAEHNGNVRLTISHENIPHQFSLMYLISCPDGYADKHPVIAFRDLPVPVTSSSPTERRKEDRPHLEGNFPIFDLEEAVQGEEEGVSFLIVRTVECTHASVLMVNSGGTLRWTEDIYIKSEMSKQFMQQITTSYFQPVVEDNDDRLLSKKNKAPPTGPKVGAMKQFEKQRIFPADQFFFHHRPLLKSYSETHSETKLHTEALLEYINRQYGEEFASATGYFERGEITQHNIKYLYKPNDVIISGPLGKFAAFVLQEWPIIKMDGWITLTCWSFQTAGTEYVRKQVLLDISPLAESKESQIRDLVAYPIKYATTEVRSSIRARGEKHWDLRIATPVTYRGWTVGHDQYFSDGRFMIDHQVFRKMHRNASAFYFETPDTTHPFDTMPAALNIGQEPTDICFLLMPPDVYGFYLHEKKWIRLFVDDIHPVSWNKKAFERLVLPPAMKDLVEALVTVRKKQKGVTQGLGMAGKRIDITNGKGNGLIMLLHGGPGTGKTLTGESVAELAEMPLYRVTCGDIGIDAEAVEKYMNTVLHLGKIWNCVLLLDEADVFLEERSMSDLQRNSLVSVFLRILEYYDGILILTSNRVGLFDEAFKSRIQVALHYENLTLSSRKKIWQNFFEMLEEDEEDVNLDELRLHLDELARKELNGRQIRNVLTTARQLAMYREQRLDWKHLAQALSVSAEFSEYLKTMHGHTDDQRARDIGLR